MQEQKQKKEIRNTYSTSPGLAEWLQENNLSLAFTSYDSNYLYLVGQKDGAVSIVFRNYDRPMGLDYANGTLFLVANSLIVELENIGSGGEKFDAVFVPRRTNLINNCDAHEVRVSIALDNVFFAATSYSCIAETSKRHSFSPYWYPDFISKLVPEDRCHLNGFDLDSKGNLSLVSYVAKSDMIEGWRSNRSNGGVVYDVQNHKYIHNLSMPHSPRFYGEFRHEKIFYLDSGRGFLCGPDLKVFCPGFLRGLRFHNHYAITTVSLPREGIFKGLDLEDNLKQRGGEAWCGVLVINMMTEAIEHWFRIEGDTRELFDVVTIPNISCPNAIAPADPTLLNRVTIQP